MAQEIEGLGFDVAGIDFKQHDLGAREFMQQPKNCAVAYLLLHLIQLPA